MKNWLKISILVILVSSCKASHMGKAKYGKNGEIESGTVKTRCTYPKKTYTKDLDLKVKAAIDSLAYTPSADIELQLKRTVTRLSDYSSEGLDTDLILFRICEISLNKGFSKEQTAALTQAALDAWAKKKQNP